MNTKREVRNRGRARGSTPGRTGPDKVRIFDFSLSGLVFRKSQIQRRQAEACPTGAWWPIALLFLVCGVAAFRAGDSGVIAQLPRAALAPIHSGLVGTASIGAGAAPALQFATGLGVRIYDGTNTLLVDPCKGQTKQYASISQTANAQLATGTASKKIYVCSMHVVVSSAANVALVEGTGSVCATSTTGVTGFGGATAATGWNFGANGGISVGNGDSSLGAEGTSGDNLCLFNSGSGQVSGGLSYVVQ